jgi:tetratricopeptide (TPR) repeat protein
MRILREVVCGLAALMTAACATTGAGRPATPVAPATEAAPSPPLSDSLETFIGKVRERSVRTRSKDVSPGAMETSDGALAAALLAVTVHPSAARHRAVSDEYLRLGILDKAHEHLSAVVTLDPRNAPAWDGLARIWRNWGFPHLGLADAHRAVYFAQASPVAHNTLGTLFQALGRRVDARREYEKALQLDPTAAYAASNLCYGWVLDDDVTKAERACRLALRLQPELPAARNNLGLAYAASGNLVAAERMFASPGGVGRTQYNLGMVHLARRRYSDAVRAFEAAQLFRPGVGAAKALARQARTAQAERENTQ